MEKLPMCRICLAQNVRMYVVVNKNLCEFYEKLTDHPFVTEDSRPMLTCFFCCTKLKQCYQFQQKCLEAEQRFTQMMNGDYEPNPLPNQDHPEFCNGFIQSPIEHISIVDECQTESVAIKEELPAVCERLDDIIEPKEEHQSDGLKLETQESSFSDVENVLVHHFKVELENDEPLMEFKIEVEEHEVPRKKWTASDTQRAPAVKKPKLHSQRTNLEDVITEEQKEYEQSDTTVIQNPQNCTFTTVTKFKEPLPYTTPRVNNSSLDINGRNDSNNEDRKCEITSKGIDSNDVNGHPRLVQEKRFKCDMCQRSFSRNDNLTKHKRLHTGDKPYKCDVCQLCFSEKRYLTNHLRTHTGEKPYKCDICQRSFNRSDNLTKHIRVHTGEKPYKCAFCHHCFSEKNTLTSHLRRHTGEKPYKCDTCQRRFKQKATLSNHLRTHTVEKRYKCDICHHSFNNKRNFTRHTRIHAGEKLNE